MFRLERSHPALKWFPQCVFQAVQPVVIMQYMLPLYWRNSPFTYQEKRAVVVVVADVGPTASLLHS